MAHDPIPDKPVAKRCNDELVPDGEYPCALPEGHDGAHTPLPVLWQMAGFASGPWDAEHTAELRALLIGSPTQ